MKEEEYLREWYKSINENDISPSGMIKIKVPVLDADSGQQVSVNAVSSPDQENDQQGTKTDSVEAKSKDSALSSFVLAKRIQDLLLRTAGLNNPYNEDSEERQSILDKVRNLYRELGVNIAAL